MANNTTYSIQQAGNMNQIQQFFIICQFLFVTSKFVLFLITYHYTESSYSQFKKPFYKQSQLPLQQQLMNKNSFNKQLSQPRGNYVPVFLQNKHSSQKEFAYPKRKNVFTTTKEFEQVRVSLFSAKAEVYNRIRLWIKNTPKVVINEETKQYLSISVQNPKKFFIQTIKPFRKSVQLEKIKEITLVLFQLIDIYGYFYCDKQMLRVSEDGSSIAWINEKFFQNQREFPIRSSSVAQLIFIKKLKETFDQILHCKKNSQIETKKQFLNFLDSEKQKFHALYEQFPSVPIIRVGKNHTQHNISTPKISPSTSKSPSHKNRHNLELRIGKLDKGRNTLNIYELNKSGQHTNKNIRSDCFLKKQQQSFYENNGRTKTMNLQFFGINSPTQRENQDQYQRVKEMRLTNQSYLSTSCKEKSAKSKKKANFLAPPSPNHIFFGQSAKSNTQLEIPQILYKSTSKNTNRSEIIEDGDTIYDEFNFEQEIIEKPKPSNETNTHSKGRKKSVDVDFVSTWFKADSKMPEVKFPSSTFSTRVTFSSLRGQLESSTEKEEGKQRKNDSKQQSHTIPHLYSLEKDKETKEKMNAGIKKIMKQSGLKIDEDSFQNEVESLLDSGFLESSKENKSYKQSILMEELDKILASSRQLGYVENSLVNQVQRLLD